MNDAEKLEAIRRYAEERARYGLRGRTVHSIRIASDLLYILDGKVGLPVEPTPKTAWIRIDIRWHDRSNGLLREISDGSQMIEVVCAAPGEILVQDEPSGTHRMIPLTHLEGVRTA